MAHSRERGKGLLCSMLESGSQGSSLTPGDVILILMPGNKLAVAF